MTRADYMTIERIIDNQEEREKRLCAEYVQLNPADKERRERDRDLIIFGLESVRLDIYKLWKKEGFTE